MSVDDFLERLIAALAQSGVPYMVSEYVEHWVRELGVGDEWRKALAMAG